MLFKWIAVFAAGISATLAQTIELGFPQNGDNFCPGQEATTRLFNRWESVASTVQVGIALGIDDCENGLWPDPADGLGFVLYAGPWTPESHGPPYAYGYYQNFTVTILSYLTKGPAIFTLTHFCLIGADWYLFLEFRNVTVKVV
ncbi:uncharacterized protein F5891DRAFT_1173349 [Suillus fuscotomentosus]|uniref:Uncharacterized protein n=1 Tax=Suillus fuscotomentosus TaxID=1912939 RepID=A0AAD4HKJ0_9AGAM|nr:uncharacterized protein F5891DRAFT_1173349 [Suillus fuscotomentosus]KAG1899998.1 hypothetical protein F5891DRAFT_1173349 [Suillus fuscotomentosus]